MTNPTARELRTAFINGEGWTEDEWNEFAEKHAQLFNGFQPSNLSWDEWYILACEEGEW